jgi:hypothetical protein
MAEATSLKDRVVSDPPGSVRATARRSIARLATVAAIIGMAGCSSGLSGRPTASGALSTAKTPSTTTTPSTTSTSIRASTTTVSGSQGATRAAVLNAWESAQQTLYSYMDQPWPQARDDLVAGETTADLWPELADYFNDPALQSEGVFLIGVKMGQLNGPSTYNLGHPVVTSVTATTATVTGCIYDTGTTTATGAPGPTTLDGGVGSSNGWWDLELLNGSWRITTFEETSVSRC